MMKAKQILCLWLCLMCGLAADAERTESFPRVTDEPHPDFFPLSEAAIYTDAGDYEVVHLTAKMLADDVERVTTRRPIEQQLKSPRSIPAGIAVVAGTLGKNKMIDWLVRKQQINTEAIKGKWESAIIMTTEHPT